VIQWYDDVIGVSDDIAIRFQGLDSGGHDWRTDLRTLFSNRYNFAELRGQSLSLNHGKPPLPYHSCNFDGLSFAYHTFVM
jgi:hypothetical protein